MTRCWTASKGEAQGAAGAPLLLSFCVRDPASRRYPLIRAIANAVRRVRGRELAEAGPELRAFTDAPYGHSAAFVLHQTVDTLAQLVANWQLTCRPPP